MLRPESTSARGRLAGLLIVVLLLSGSARARFQQAPPARPPAIVPTAHPAVPRDRDQIWLVPADAAQARDLSAGLGGFQDGIRLFQEGDYESALKLLGDPAWRTTPLAAYADYYAGLAQLRLKRFDDALRTWTTLIRTTPAGYLSEGASLAAGEAADELDQQAVALRLYEDLAARKTVATDEVLYRLAQAALATGDRHTAADTLLRIYYGSPLSERARLAATDLKSLRREAGGPGTRATYGKDLDRAQRLFAAGRYEEARAALLDLRALAGREDRPRVDLRLAASEYYLKRYRSARDRLRPYVDRASPDQPEVGFYYLSAMRGLRQSREFVTRARALAAQFPDSPWAEAALDALGTYYLVQDDDAAAIEVFRDLCTRFPAGRHAERAAWKAGWWAFRHGDFAEAARLFEGAATTFPRSDYRPSYVYWSGRARTAMGDKSLARARFEVAVADYGSSYYGRLAARDLAGLGGSPPAASASSSVAMPAHAKASGALPPTASLIRVLVAMELYDAALNELEYARLAWGDTPAIEATIAFVLNRQGDYRRGALVIKRAYPQFLTAGNGALPDEVLRIVFPLDHWALIQRYAASNDLDPHLVAALVAQESMFDAGVRSAANAYGLMQLVPPTARRIGRSLGVRRVTTRSLTDAELNLRLGTKHLADLLKEFKEPHLALAAYNAGEQNVVRWRRERPGLPQDEFIDDIPFPETQTYVRRILGTADDYRRLYPTGSEPGAR